MLEVLTLKPEAFGIDISDLSLKIIKLKKSGRLFERASPLAGKFLRKSDFLGLASFGEQDIKPGIIEEGEIKDEKALTEIIKTAVTKVKGEKLRTKYVVVSLPEEKGFLQVIQMPIMKAEELKRAVYFEAENYVPMPIDQVYLDSQVIKPVYNHLDHLDVLIAALPKKIVDPYVSCLKKAGLQPRTLEIESLAIARALIKNEVSTAPILLIDLGETRTSFIIFSGHSLRFTTAIPVSSQKFTEAISKTLKVDLKEAEILKLKYGIRADAKKKGRKVFEAMVPVLTDLIEQIKKYLAYYQSHASHEHLPSIPGEARPPGRPDGRGVEEIYLCGGGANLKGICDFLSRELRLSVALGNPWINILPEPLREVPELPFEKSLGYTTALGLALRGIRNF